MKKKLVVVALGHKALGTTLPEQKEAVFHTARIIADLIEADYQLVISHSNAPQVGMIHTAMNEFRQSHPDYTVAPMSVCSAMSQGYIGYDLQNAIREELLNRDIYRPISTILTQVVVDPFDDAFYHPTKKIGRYMTKAEADAEEKKGNYVMDEPGIGYRRIVAAPKPTDIVEIDAIQALVNAGQIVIACGGGGIPVMQQNNRLKGASAVIEKDLASAKLAELVNADHLLMLTSVDKVYLNYGSPNETGVTHMTVDEAAKYMEERHFAEGTMRPKLEAAVQFISGNPNRTAIVALLEEADSALKGLAGTTITNN